jgi:hypothetical protein
MPALVVAYETLGNAFKASDIMNRNKFKDWNAIPAGQSVEVVV